MNREVEKIRRRSDKIRSNRSDGKRTNKARSTAVARKVRRNEKRVG